MLVGYGYKSEVVLVLNDELANVFEALLEHHREMSDLCDIAEQFERNDKAMLIRWPSIKWYPSYPVVDDVLQFLTAFAEKHYRLIRVGSNHGDYEEQGTFDYPHIEFVQKLEVFI